MGELLETGHLPLAVEAGRIVGGETGAAARSEV
jgi:hypothetical protein